ncbi:MAG: calcium-binding protein [Solirubrobacterales bacterium]
MSRGFLAGLGLVTAACALVLSAPAHAATAWVEQVPPSGPGGFPAVQLHYAADPGETNSPYFEFKEGEQVPDSNTVTANKAVVITDRGAHVIKPGFGCVPLGLTKVLCDSSTSSQPSDPNWDFYWGFDFVAVTLGDRDDSMAQNGMTSLAMRVDAGPGNDIITTGDSYDTLIGGPGDDRLQGGGYSDQLVGGPGADDMSGGAGVSTDSVLYGGPGEPDVPRAISIDEVANDGASGEADNIHSDVEDVFVDSSAPNIFIGNDGPNYFGGGTGTDVMYGFGGNDTLGGWKGNDRLDGGAGRDYLSGGPDDDVLTARDGETDYGLSCDDGTDQLTADVIDPPSIGCEQDNRG